MKLSAPKIQELSHAKKLVVITAYDYPSAKLVDEIVDIVLVGDSLGMVIQGSENTLSVTMDQMVYHSQIVSKGLKKAHLVCDMPFMSYQASTEEAVKNAGRLISEGLAQSVKLEGGVEVAETVEKIVTCGIPVMGHLGLTPQSFHQMGGFKVQGKTHPAAQKLMEDARHLEKAGCYAIVLEGIPGELAKEITSAISIPTIGIFAGPHCKGQVLVWHDLLGIDPEFRPKFVKPFAQLHETIRAAVQNFKQEVEQGIFPNESNYV